MKYNYSVILLFLRNEKEFQQQEYFLDLLQN